MINEKDIKKEFRIIGLLILLVGLAVALSYSQVRDLQKQVGQNTETIENLTAAPQYESVCANTCNAVARAEAIDDNGTMYNYTVPHTYLLTSTDKYDYCTCLFQGTGQTFSFDAAVKAAFDEESKE